MLVAIPAKDHRFVRHALRDPTQMIIKHIVNSARLAFTVSEEFNHRVISGPSLLQVLDIVPLAAVDTSVMVINEWSALLVPSVMDPSLPVLLVHQEPSVQAKVTRPRLLVRTAGILLLTPLHVKSAKLGSCVRKELKEIVLLGKLVVEVLHTIVLLVTIPMVEEAAVSRVRLGDTIPRRRHRVRMTAPLVLSI